MVALTPQYPAVVNSSHYHKRDHSSESEEGENDVEVIDPLRTAAEEDRYREHHARRHEFHQLTVVVHVLSSVSC